ncbi:ABC transporter ATP-binding protein [Novosphingobium sp. AP12]|uniref:ABC transporter ATP-binding protein n=1 Tax=Novosphingobium sp. AP12 TaxID=1144305 RepID=UPI0002721A74|nr:ATP-binding cassette domain-containing protein [Novosphingobium sp. AP12]EJL20855.1 ABC-type transport system involved in resistance to organic solvents, ATPase component [Novosphingobium sp. AP12]
MTDVAEDQVKAPQPGTDEGEYPIVVKGLRNTFGDHVIHEALELKVRKGEILGVVGGSGTGKSVLMRSIIGLQQPESGEITVLGHKMGDSTEEDSIDLRSRWGVLFQGGALFSTLTVGENVEVPLKQFFPEISDHLRGDIARFKVRLSGLAEESAFKYPNELSGGMRKRAGLARALALDPELLFLDEPTAGLDPIGAAAFDTLTRELKETLGLTVFLITHDLDTLYAICDRVAVLADKQVIAVGTIPELLALDHPWIQEYFNGPRGRAALAAKDDPAVTSEQETAQAVDTASASTDAPTGAGEGASKIDMRKSGA